MDGDVSRGARNYGRTSGFIDFKKLPLSRKRAQDPDPSHPQLLLGPWLIRQRKASQGSLFKMHLFFIVLPTWGHAPSPRQEIFPLTVATCAENTGPKVSAVRHSFSGLICKPHRHSLLGLGDNPETAQACGVGLHTRSRTSRLEDFRPMPPCPGVPAGLLHCRRTPLPSGAFLPPCPTRCRTVISGSLSSTQPLFTSL